MRINANGVVWNRVLSFLVVLWAATLIFSVASVGARATSLQPVTFERKVLSPALPEAPFPLRFFAGAVKTNSRGEIITGPDDDPVKKLVVPKLAATLVMLPVLTILGDLLGILGGLAIAVLQLDLTARFYMNDVLSSLTIEDVAHGVGKSFFFAYFIALVGCYNGLHAKGGADGVGRATTNTVVMASILVLVADFFLTKLFYLLG